MLYLHSGAERMLHRDLRSPNLLVAEGYRVKVGVVQESSHLPWHPNLSWAEQPAEQGSSRQQVACSAPQCTSPLASHPLLNRLQTST